MTFNRFSILILLVLGTGLASAAAQTVAEDVLKGSEIQGIEFRNYVGPHKVIETRLAIQGIGVDLGRQMKAPGATEADYGGKYRILRLHDPASDKLSADLLILGPAAGVDHIRNLNWIVSAYLQQVFAYSPTDADLLAAFVTRYNAFYRGKMDYFASAFIPAVAQNLTAETAGLALSYADWPGKTRIVLPLRDSLSKGLGGSLNTEEISNKDITTQMAATEPDQGLADRKKLADLKEGEIVQEQKAVAQAEARVPSTPAAEGVGPTLAPPAGPAPTTPAAGATTPAAAEKTMPVTEAKKDVAARDAALQAERKDIVAQETKKPEAPAAPPAPVKPAVVAGLVVRTAKAGMGSLWLVDPATNKVWKKSDLNTVRQAEAPAFGAGLLVVAGDAQGANGAVRLVLLSKDDATVLATGADDVPADTPLVLTGTQVLALTKADKGWVLGAFDPTLKALAKGTDLLSPLTAIVPTSTGILVQSASGKPLLLDSATLKKKSDTEG